MPNYIKNRIELIGKEKHVKELIEGASTFFPEKQNTSYDGDLTYENDGEYGWLNVESNLFTRRNKDDVIGVPKGWMKHMVSEFTQFPDFNKLIQMPEDLNISSGSNGDEGYALITGNSQNQFMTIEEQTSRFYQKKIDARIESIELGLRYAKNMQKYGFKTWYEWAIENWGTKWNSSECNKLNRNTYEFITAWSGVPNLIETLSKKFPDVKIIYEFSDEDTGCNCGIGLYFGDSASFEMIENSSIEAYDLAFKLRPDYKKNYQLVDGNYEYIEEE